MREVTFRVEEVGDVIGQSVSPFFDGHEVRVGLSGDRDSKLQGNRYIGNHLISCYNEDLIEVRALDEFEEEAIRFVEVEFTTFGFEFLVRKDNHPDSIGVYEIEV